jgi:DNA-binding transcriptional MerR regulator
MTEELLSIGRFGRLTGLTVKALRHYDAEDLLKPHEVDPSTAYRYYGVEQVERGRLIRRLRDLDVPLDVLGDVLAARDAGDPEKAKELLERHLGHVEAGLWHHQRVAHRLRVLLSGEETSMLEPNAQIEQDERRQVATDLFNETWTMMERTDRTPDDDLRMLHMAHASRFHWGEIGTASHRDKGEWQVSRVYTVLGRAEPALFHARACLRICEENDITDWELAFAHEALARAYMVAGERQQTEVHLRRARELGELIADPEDKALLDQDLATITV